MLQDAWLFTGSIRDNIEYGLPGASDAEIVAAAQASHVDHFVRALPAGYATMLGNDGDSLSRGQRQLISIARAQLAGRSILILDEATSSVDSRTEIQIRQAMARLRQGRTSLVIAHRLSTVRDADLILVMDHGRIVEQGKHQELMAEERHYTRLYRTQFAGREQLEAALEPDCEPGRGRCCHFSRHLEAQYRQFRSPVRTAPAATSSSGPTPEPSRPGPGSPRSAAWRPSWAWRRTPWREPTRNSRPPASSRPGAGTAPSSAPGTTRGAH